MTATDPTVHLIVAGVEQADTCWKCSCGAGGQAPCHGEDCNVERLAERHIPAGDQVRWRWAS